MPTDALAHRPRCPYPGMTPFGEADHDRFFGRTADVETLLHLLRLHPFVAVIGPSGSGKSSLVSAGLVPALRKSSLFGDGELHVSTLRPGASPLAALQAALGSGGDASVGVDLDKYLGQEPGERRLVVVDQFEELFTVSDQDEVDAFLEGLHWLSAKPGWRIILTVRADFYAELMTSAIWPQIRGHRMELLPLDEPDLREAILRPAEAVGVYVEAALVERLAADAAGEPGLLPLLQETLVLLWERLERRFLPLRAYEALVLPRRAYMGQGYPESSGLQVAMVRRADMALGRLAPEQQAVARRVFLRLVQFGEGRADTRRQRRLADLGDGTNESELLEATIHLLAEQRLLTLGGDERGSRTVDLVHEMLISGWPTLSDWIAERREAELIRRRLDAKAEEWVRL